MRSKNKQYLLLLDVHWTHSNVVAYGVGEDALHNRENAIVFVGDVLVKSNVSCVIISLQKHRLTGFYALGGRASLRDVSGRPPEAW